jgi:hypothetical protein
MPTQISAVIELMATTTIGFIVSFVSQFWVWILGFVVLAAVAGFILHKGKRALGTGGGH